MRAFMSVPGDGPIYFDGDTLAHADGRTFRAPIWQTEAIEAIRLAQFAADCEARAILAVTEPVQNNPDGSERSFHVALRGPWIAREADALADALRAFVGEE